MNLLTTARILIVSAAALATLVLVPLAQASAVGPIHYLISDGAQGGLLLFINDPGIGNIAKTVKTGTTNFTLDTSGQAKFNGHTTFKMRVNGGTDCLQGNSDFHIYDEGCNANGTNQQFYHVDNFIYSVGLTNFEGAPAALMASSNASGATISAFTGLSPAPLNQWAFDAIEQ